MHYMVIERFKEGAAPEIYRRFRERGRMMPAGLWYRPAYYGTSGRPAWRIRAPPKSKAKICDSG